MKKVVQIGVGAIGSPVVVFARNWDVEYTIIDFDKVEMKNTQAQMHERQGLRRNKAQALSRLMRGLWGRQVNPLTAKLNAQNYAQLLGDADLIIDTTDNIEARLLIQKAALRDPAGLERKTPIPCLHGCLALSGDFARVIWTEHFSPDSEGGGNVPTCEDGENLPFFSLVGAHIAQEAQRFLTEGTKRSLHISPASVMRFA
jgi:hypothetical protein